MRMKRTGVFYSDLFFVSLGVSCSVENKSSKVSSNDNMQVNLSSLEEGEDYIGGRINR
jgi:hypothetical protein